MHHLPLGGAQDSRDFQAVNTSAEAASENSLVKTDMYSLIQFFIQSLNIIMEHLRGASHLPFTLHRLLLLLLGRFSRV